MAFVAATLAVPAAQAGSKEMERAAQAACLSGDYAKGVAILAELYVDSREAIYIFNQGRCFEQNGRYEEAILRFREFQRKNASAGRPLDPEAEKHIADCQALLDKQKPVAAPTPPPLVAEPATITPTPTDRPAAVESKPEPGLQASPAAAPPLPLSPPVAPGPLTAAPLPTPLPTGQAANQADLTQSSLPSQPQPEGSILGRWWFWTAVGVVVAGGVTAALLLSRGGGTGTPPFCPDCDDKAGVDLR